MFDDERLHLFVVSGDLNIFDDVHFTVPASGVAMTEVTFPIDGTYTLRVRGRAVWIVDRPVLIVVGAPSAATPLVVNDAALSANGLRITPTTLSPLPAGVPLILGYTVTQEGGSQIVPMRPEHLVLVKDGLAEMIEPRAASYAGGHGTPEQVASGALAFEATIPSPGTYAAFLRATASGRPVTARFVYEVQPLPDDAALDAHAGHDAATMDPSKVRIVSVEAFQYGFTPNTVRVAQGEHVRLLLSTRDVAHSFTLEEYDVNVTIVPGEALSVEFMADRPGRFPFGCDVYCGEGHDEMARSGGWLVVEP